MPPHVIPIDYVTRAAALWRGGECYTVDSSVTNGPLWWVNCAPPGASSLSMSLTKLAESSATRSFWPSDYVPGETIAVQVSASPRRTVQAYAVEDRPPQGWAISAISHGGGLDAVSGRVKWGPFFDATPRTFTYQATSPSISGGNAYFAGLASFDGVNATLAGTAQMREVCRLNGCLQIAQGRFQVTVTGRAGARILLETSVDLAAWTPLVTLTNTSGRLEFSDPAGLNFSQRFYRAVSLP